MMDGVKYLRSGIKIIWFSAVILNYHDTVKTRQLIFLLHLLTPIQPYETFTIHLCVNRLDNSPVFERM